MVQAWKDRKETRTLFQRVSWLKKLLGQKEIWHMRHSLSVMLHFWEVAMMSFLFFRANRRPATNFPSVFSCLPLTNEVPLEVSAETTKSDPWPIFPTSNRRGDNLGCRATWHRKGNQKRRHSKRAAPGSLECIYGIIYIFLPCVIRVHYSCLGCRRDYFPTLG